MNLGPEIMEALGMGNWRDVEWMVLLQALREIEKCNIFTVLMDGECNVIYAKVCGQVTSP